MINQIIERFDDLAKRLEGNSNFTFTETPLQHLHSQGLNVKNIVDNILSSPDYENLSDRSIDEGIFIKFLLPYLIGNCGTLLESHIVASKLTAAEYARSIVLSLQNRESMVGALCLRAFIEKLAQLYYVSNILTERTQPHQTKLAIIDIELAQEEALNNIKNIKEGFSGVRFNWEKAVAFGTAELTANQRKKKLTGALFGSDYASHSINVMKMIDSLNKEIKTVRSAYDVLSEFSHPNLMQSLAFDEDFPRVSKFAGLDYGPWKRTIACDVDSPSPRGFEHKLIDFYSTITALTDCFEAHSVTIGKHIAAFKKKDRALIRLSIKETPVYCALDPCPCGRDLVIGKCCGRKLKHYMIDAKRRQELFAGIKSQDLPS